MSEPQASSKALPRPSEFQVGTLDGSPLRATFPLRATVFGVEVVVIPAAEYEARLEAAASYRPKARSRIANDPEVAEFLADRLPHLGLDQAVDECRRRFGAARTPSRTAMSRYKNRLAAGLGTPIRSSQSRLSGPR